MFSEKFFVGFVYALSFLFDFVWNRGFFLICFLFLAFGLAFNVMSLIIDLADADPRTKELNEICNESPSFRGNSRRSSRRSPRRSPRVNPRESPRRSARVSSRSRDAGDRDSE